MYTASDRSFQRTTAALPPKGECRHDWQIFADLSTRMGYPMHYRDTQEIWDEVRSLCPQFAGATYEKMAGTGYAQWPIFAEAADDPDNHGTAELFAGGIFTTPDGKGRLEAAAWRPPTEQPDERYPLVLCTVREVGHYSCRSMTGNCKALAALADEPGYVSISPVDADARGIDEEQLVWVASRRGKVLARAAVDERINDGAVYMTYQWWIGKCNELTLHATDGESGTPEDKYSACQVEAIPDQAWAETYLVERYAELKAQLAAEADRQNPQPETEISAASSEVADVVPAVPGGATEGGEAAGVEGSRAALAGGVSGGSRRPIGCRRRAAPRVRAARGRGGGPRAVRERRGRDARMNRFVVSDPSRCIGCSACRVTCTESHRRRALRPASRISLVKTRTVSAAVTCHQCEGAPCMTVCPEGAIVQERVRLHRWTKAG